MEDVTAAARHSAKIQYVWAYRVYMHTLANEHMSMHVLGANFI